MCKTITDRLLCSQARSALARGFRAASQVQRLHPCVDIVVGLGPPPSGDGLPDVEFEVYAYKGATDTLKLRAGLTVESMRRSLGKIAYETTVRAICGAA